MTYHEKNECRLIGIRESALRIERAAFFYFYLHEQFHHKVESAGLRLLISRRDLLPGRSSYAEYKKNVYRKTYPSVDCIEETRANIDAFLRTREKKYREAVGSPFLGVLQRFMLTSFRHQLPAYKKASEYLDGLTIKEQEHNAKELLFELQSQLLSGNLAHGLRNEDWSMSTYLIRSLFDIKKNIWVIVPKGRRPTVPTTHVAPFLTCSTDKAVSALAHIIHDSHRV
jgi:hypothetical protein